MLRVVVGMFWPCIGGMFGSGGGWEYSCKGSLYFRISVSSFSGRNGNSFVILCMSSVSLFWLMKLYISLWMVLVGLVMC